jgi:hypothetical protein
VIRIKELGRRVSENKALNWMWGGYEGCDTKQFADVSEELTATM